MESSTFVILGTQELRDKLALMPGRALGILGGALVECGEEVKARSVKRAPKKTGMLRNTAMVFGEWAGRVAYARSAFGSASAANRASLGAGTKDGVEVTIAYGGPSADYALFVHEAPQELNWTLPGTGPKFLERPAKEYPLGVKLSSKVQGRIGRAMAGKAGV
jgi:hypothetical protein